MFTFNAYISNKVSVCVIDLQPGADWLKKTPFADKKKDHYGGGGVAPDCLRSSQTPFSYGQAAPFSNHHKS
jgi:hypothetical protein